MPSKGTVSPGCSKLHGNSPLLMLNLLKSTGSPSPPSSSNHSSLQEQETVLAQASVSEGPAKARASWAPSLSQGERNSQSSAECIREHSQHTLQLWSALFVLYELHVWDFLGSPDGKRSACHAGDTGLIPGSGRSPGEGNDYPLQYSCLENPMDRGAWRATVHGIPKNRI